jgi:thiol:disulfide interchange protein DsbC
MHMNIVRWRLVQLTLLMSIVVTGVVLAQNEPWQDTLRETINTSLGAASQGQLRVESMKETPMADVVEVILSSGEILFSDKSGRFMIAGEMYMTRPEGLVNLTAETRKDQVRQLLAGVPEDQMVIFEPEGETMATISVFTDVDCTYCRRLHHDVEAINANGIRVRYLAYPRGGLESTAYPKMISVWCSDDRNRAITQAKNGQNLPERDCQNPVLNHHSLGNRIGITGTPAIVLPDGTLIPGYMDTERLTAAVLGQ